MHELSIVQKIVAAADEAAQKNAITHVRVIHLRIGKMSAAHPEQIRFGFNTYAKGSRLEGANLIIDEVDVALECKGCGHIFGDKRFDDHDFAHTIAHAPMIYVAAHCPACGCEAKIARGNELELVDIEGE